MGCYERTANLCRLSLSRKVDFTPLAPQPESFYTLL